MKSYTFISFGNRKKGKITRHRWYKDPEIQIYRNGNMEKMSRIEKQQTFEAKTNIVDIFLDNLSLWITTMLLTANHFFIHVPLFYRLFEWNEKKRPPFLFTKIFPFSFIYRLLTYLFPFILMSHFVCVCRL